MVKEIESESRSVVSDSLWPRGLYRPWNSPGQNTGVAAFPFSRGSFPPRNLTGVSCIAGWFITGWVTREAQLVVHILIRSTYWHFSHLFNTLTPASLMIPVESFCHNDKTRSGWWSALGCRKEHFITEQWSFYMDIWLYDLYGHLVIWFIWSYGYMIYMIIWLYIYKW